jgi:glyceraldehyde-3-phosphate dehydrogenase/erythrose-4-phosphate dehydrogenase
MAFRVPAADIFVGDLTVRLEKATTYEQRLQAMYMVVDSVLRKMDGFLR